MNEYKKKLAEQAGQVNKASAPDAPVATNGIPNSALLSVFEGKAHATSQMMGHRVNLAESINAKMTQAFGMDISQLQVYRSDAMVGTGMHGMAQGNKVVLSSDVNLNTTEGQAVLGHEISHIRAQSQGIGMGHGGLYNNAGLEAQADREGMLAAHGRPIYQDNMVFSDGMKYGLGMKGVEGLSPMSPGLGATAAAPMQAEKEKNNVDVKALKEGAAKAKDPKNNISTKNYRKNLEKAEYKFGLSDNIRKYAGDIGFTEDDLNDVVETNNLKKTIKETNKLHNEIGKQQIPGFEVSRKMRKKYEQGDKNSEFRVPAQVNMITQAIPELKAENQIRKIRRKPALKRKPNKRKHNKKRREVAGKPVDAKDFLKVKKSIIQEIAGKENGNKGIVNEEYSNEQIGNQGIVNKEYEKLEKIVDIPNPLKSTSKAGKFKNPGKTVHGFDNFHTKNQKLIDEINQKKPTENNLSTNENKVAALRDFVGTSGMPGVKKPKQYVTKEAVKANKEAVLEAFYKKDTGLKKPENYDPTKRKARDLIQSKSGELSRFNDDDEDGLDLTYTTTNWKLQIMNQMKQDQANAQKKKK